MTGPRAVPLRIDLPGIGLRPAGDADQPFLRRLYASTREAELQSAGWNAAQQAAFLAMQFDAQQRAYRAYPDAEFLVIERQGEPAGRLYLQHGAAALRVIDISLLSEFRRQGIGGAVLGAVIALAAHSGRTVNLQVARHNRAQSLYRRLGFAVAHDDGATLSMVSVP